MFSDDCMVCSFVGLMSLKKSDAVRCGIRLPWKSSPQGQNIYSAMSPDNFKEVNFNNLVYIVIAPIISTETSV